MRRTRTARSPRAGDPLERPEAELRRDEERGRDRRGARIDGAVRRLRKTPYAAPTPASPTGRADGRRVTSAAAISAQPAAPTPSTTCEQPLARRGRVDDNGPGKCKAQERRGYAPTALARRRYELTSSTAAASDESSPHTATGIPARSNRPRSASRRNRQSLCAISPRSLCGLGTSDNGEISITTRSNPRARADRAAPPPPARPATASARARAPAAAGCVAERC